LENPFPLGTENYTCTRRVPHSSSKHESVFQDHNLLSTGMGRPDRQTSQQFSESNWKISVAKLIIWYKQHELVKGSAHPHSTSYYQERHPPPLVNQHIVPGPFSDYHVEPSADNEGNVKIPITSPVIDRGFLLQEIPQMVPFWRIAICTVSFCQSKRNWGSL